jgi:hypothetical protein
MDACLGAFLFFSLVQSLVDLGNLLHPLASRVMLQLEYVIERPVKIVGDVSYLLEKVFEGVAFYPPGLPISTSNL